MVIIQPKIFPQGKMRQLQTYFVYFKTAAAQHWGKRAAEERVFLF